MSIQQKILLLFAFLPLFGWGQAETLWKDTYDQSNEAWTLRDGEQSYAKIENGQYSIKHFDEKGSALYWHSGIDIDPAYDFEISSELVLTEGRGEAYGMIWGAADAANFYGFTISQNGKFRVFKYADRKYGQIRDWNAVTGTVQPTGKPNQFKIRKHGAELIFFLNGKEQYRTPFQSFFGNRVGYILYGKNSVLADNFLVTQDKNLPLLFGVNFADDARKWFQTQQSFDQAIFADGKYILEGKQPNARKFDMRSIPINTGQDFEISVRCMQVAGADDKGFGVAWGGENAQNVYTFMVTNMGAYRLAEWEDGEPFYLLDWTPSDQILGVDGESAKLTVKKEDEYFTFYLNDKLLYRADFADFFGDQVGFVVEDTMMVAFDHLVVRQGMKIETFSPPGITWFKPVNAQSTLYRKSLTVEAGLNSTSELGTVSLYLNGDLIRQAQCSTLPAENGYSAIFRQELDLKSGDNEIKILVKNTNGTLTEETRKVLVNVQEETEKKQGTDYALLFATDEYDFWADLTNPVNDARAIAQELREHYGYTVEIVENANKADVLKKLKEYAKREYQPMDQLFIFFAGHGKFDEYFGEGYVVATNSLKDDEGNDSYISQSTLRTIINNIPCEHLFLVMDVCFGGTIDPFIAQGGHRGGTDQYKELSETEFITRKMRFRTRRYLTSGGKEYVPDGTPGQHSPFARKLLEALRNYGGHDKILTLSEMLIYFERVIPEPRFGEFGTNQPGSDFLFIAK